MSALLQKPLTRATCVCLWPRDQLKNTPEGTHVCETGSAGVRGIQNYLGMRTMVSSLCDQFSIILVHGQRDV
jgi:hypothetical protein